MLLDPPKSPKSANPSSAFFAGAGLSKLLKSPNDCAAAAAVLLLPSKLEKSANPLSALPDFELEEKKSSSLSVVLSFFLLLFDVVRCGSSSLA